MTSEPGFKTLLKLRNALILNIKDPTPGKWTLRVSAEGAHTIRVTGLSSLDFVHGFSMKPTLVLSETDARPIKGLTFCL
jgi:hemicentin